MRRTLELHKILSMANISLLVFVGYMVVNMICARDVGQEEVTSCKVVDQTEGVGVNQDLSAAANLKIILERNIFGSGPIGAVQEDSSKNRSLSPPSAPAAGNQLELRLLGTVAGDEEIACAIIEDMRTKVQDLYRTGDTVQGASIVKIERNRIILLHEEIREIVDLHVTEQAQIASVESMKPKSTVEPSVVDAVKVISPTEREINKNAFLAKIGGIEAILKTVELSPYVVNGRSKGLQIKGLEGLSMAKYVGIQNGDVIQSINGQIITDERKAFQVLRKARSLSTAEIQITRGKEEKTLAFRME